MLIRRSNLLIPLGDAERVDNAWRHNADAVTLDLEQVADAKKAEAREGLKEAIGAAARGAAEVFVRVSERDLTDDLTAAVWPGLRGIVLPRVESAADVAEAAEIVTRLEGERGLASGSLQFIVLLETALGVWHIRSILAASPRVEQAALDEPDLAASLGIVPDREIDPFVYARGRLTVECTAAKVGAIGMVYPLSLEKPGTDPVFDASHIHTMATKARNSGMKGVICPHASWVNPVNAAFTPTPELVEWNRRVRAAFAQGVAKGTAAVPLDGKMIDVPVDEWAIVVLAMAEACAARDAEKAAALKGR
ncbi:MAG TPA: aldolase/citrate lyase family protein [Burkholderiales bacterium]|nr:aldolase/citrate lyase family protein [Burkholderiales bacterium]